MISFHEIPIVEKQSGAQRQVSSGIGAIELDGFHGGLHGLREDGFGKLALNHAGDFSVRETGPAEGVIGLNRDGFREVLRGLLVVIGEATGVMYKNQPRRYASCASGFTKRGLASARGAALLRVFATAMAASAGRVAAS